MLRFIVVLITLALAGCVVGYATVNNDRSPQTGVVIFNDDARVDRGN